MQKNSPETAGVSALSREALSADICVIGAGSGGLSVAAAAAAFGQRVILIEKHKMGGDCLNYGCVPSKALLAAGKRAHQIRTAPKFGIMAGEAFVDHGAVANHVRGVIEAIAPNDSIERFQGLGVRIVTAAARFTGRDTVEAGEYRITARRFVIATGSSPVVPPIPGLREVPYFTNESIFDNAQRLDHLVVIGGGPIGLEMALAHHRLGSKVTVVEGAKALAKDDPEMTAVVLDRLRREGIDIRENTLVERVEGVPGAIKLHVKSGPVEDVVEGTHLLLAAGRKPNTADLGLEAAGIKHSKSGITVGDNLRTSNRRVYAIGDVAGGLQFTHVANDHAGVVVRRILFRLPAKASGKPVPWVTYTDPELAHTGLKEDDARAKYGKVNVQRWSFHENDRAQAERDTTGHVKVVTTAKGKILGATIVGPQAGELIQIWTLAISQGLNIKALVDYISPYPTLSEVNKHAAIRYYASVPSNPLVRKVISLLAKLG